MPLSASMPLSSLFSLLPLIALQLFLTLVFLSLTECNGKATMRFWWHDPSQLLAGTPASNLCTVDCLLQLVKLKKSLFSMSWAPLS